MDVNQLFKNYKKDIIFLLILITILSIIASIRVSIQINIGAPYDTYDFLANAAEFAGKSIGYTDLRPPFLSFLTSFIFRFEELSVNPIFYVDAIIDILGAVGLYLLLKLRFNNLNSFLGSILYFTFPIVLTYVGVGFPDVPSVSLTIWALYCTVLAIKKDSRFFYISFSLALLSFLTKYNQALIIFPMLLYILINWQNIEKRKNLVIGMIISLLILIPVLIFFSLKYGDPISPFLTFYGTSSGPVSDQHFDYNPDMFFYIKLLPFAIGNGAIIILLTLLGGLLVGYLRLFKKENSIFLRKLNFKKNYLRKLGILLIFIIFLITLNSVYYLLSLMMFFFVLLGLFSFLKNKDSYDLDFLFLSWFATFLIFISVFQVKDVRYFVMIMPPLSYFLIRGLVIVEDQVGLIKKRKLTFYLTPLILAVIIISTTFYLASIPAANEYSKTLNNDIEDASHWLVNYDPNYKSKVIYSDLWPHSGWLLQTDVGKMPQFIGNTQYYNNLKDYKPTELDSEAANSFLVANNAYYYFSFRDWTKLNNFSPIGKFGLITIYKRTK